MKYPHRFATILTIFQCLMEFWDSACEVAGSYLQIWELEVRYSF